MNGHHLRVLHVEGGAHVVVAGAHEDRVTDRQALVLDVLDITQRRIDRWQVPCCQRRRLDGTCDRQTDEADHQSDQLQIPVHVSPLLSTCRIC